MFKEILSALSKLLTVSAAISASFALFLDWDISKFFIGMGVATILQLAIKWYIDRVREASITTLAEEMPAPTVKMQIECAFCKSPNVIDYNLTQDEFECENCHNVNSIYGKFFAARKAVPLDAMLTPEVPEVT